MSAVVSCLISTCNYCGLCKEVCPQTIDTGELLLASHRKMREKGAMPWAFHDFFLRDMAFANGEARLTRRPIDHERSRYVFSPGCQLGGSDPRYVTESYRTLLDHWPVTALMTFRGAQVVASPTRRSRRDAGPAERRRADPARRPARGRRRR